MESCRVVWKQCLSWVHCCILKLAIIYVAYDPLYQQMNLGWPFDWFWFCLDLFTAFMFVAVCTLDFYIARSLKPFFCFGHSIWFGLNWQWYCAIIELSWQWYHDLSKLKSESSAEATSHAIVHCLNALMIDQSDFL